MQDQHFMQSWNEGHNRFSADIDRGLGRLINRLSRRRMERQAIRDPYGIPTGTGSSLPPAAKASLRGLGATLFTAVLWVVVLALATPEPGLAASISASVNACACIGHPPLA